MKIKTMVYIALMAAILSIVSPISIPLAGGVPISLATLAVMLAGALLGKKWGTLSVFIYLCLGCIGLPVFAGYSAGFANVIGPTGGYLLGYLFLSFITGWIYQDIGKKKKGFLVLGILFGEFALYLLGTIWFMWVSKTTLLASLTWCVFPFIPGDLLKIACACILSKSLERIVQIDD